MKLEHEFRPIITTRLCLRRLQSNDAKTFYGYRSDPAVNKYQCWRPLSLGEIEAFIQEQSGLLPDMSNTWFQLAICDKHSGTMLGDGGLHFLADRSCQSEVGFTIYPPYQGLGYAAEAVKGMLEYLFLTLGKHRVFADVDPRNEPSVRVLERVGLRKEAHFRKSFRYDDEWADDAVYAILAEEWLEK